MKAHMDQVHFFEVESLFDEKWVSICRVVRDYYSTTLKNTDKYSGCLERRRRFLLSEDLCCFAVLSTHWRETGVLNEKI